jgi:site-specific DNA-methyltransferase (adenine-specific)
VARIESAERASKEGRVTTGVLEKGDAREVGPRVVRAESVALVLTDPPYGLPTLDANRGSGSNVQTTLIRGEDNLKQADALVMYAWLAGEMRRTLVPGGHFYVFVAYENWGSVSQLVKTAGLEMQEWPIVWYKGRTTTPGRGYVWTPCCEFVLFGWKPPRRRMLETNHAALVEQKHVTAGIHTFQKPEDLMRLFIVQSTIAGEVVYDPFAGSASTVVAAINAGRTGVGIDLDPDGRVFPLAQKRVSEALAKRAAVGGKPVGGKP